MRPSRKPLSHHDVVIVCEGSTTEYNYFCEIRDFITQNITSPTFSSILVIPSNTDAVKSKSGRKTREMAPDASQWRYYMLSEDNENDYQEYRAQPVRYVREAELFLLKKNYDEAWAVYDWDEKPGQNQKKHSKVQPILQRNQGRLFVAFSSYSFEEWILAHFERNTKKFSTSDCSDILGHSYMCGSASADTQYDCHGEKCIAGYLREQGYIPIYSKSDKNLFSTYTLKEGKVSRKAIFNASWLRFKGSRFSSDAYTDVDYLVSKLIDDNYCCEWFSLGESFSFSGTNLQIDKDGTLLKVKNIGKMSFVLTSSNISLTDANGDKNHSVLSGNIIIQPGEDYSVSITEAFSVLRLTNRNKDYFIEI